jgi:hypothetical protein
MSERDHMVADAIALERAAAVLRCRSKKTRRGGVPVIIEAIARAELGMAKRLREKAAAGLPPEQDPEVT